MQIISFENDLDSLRLALRHKKKFPWLRHGAPDAIVMRSTWQSRQFPGLNWHLLHGAFQETMEVSTALPDLIFYDMFSCRTQSEDWTVHAFRKLFGVCGHRPVEMFTYSTSTAVRAALLAAGFHVARGRSAGVKQETTIALTPGYSLPCRHPLLAHDWLRKWHRSHAKYPDGIPEHERPGFEHLITGHSQF